MHIYFIEHFKGKLIREVLFDISPKPNDRERMCKLPGVKAYTFKGITNFSC